MTIECGVKELRKFMIDNKVTTILLDEKSMLGQEDLGWSHPCV